MTMNFPEPSPASPPTYQGPNSPPPPLTNAEKPLPNGWVTEFDPNYQCYYYVDTLQNPPHITWEDPRNNGALYPPDDTKAPIEPIRASSDQPTASATSTDRGFLSNAISSLSGNKPSNGSTMQQMAQSPAYYNNNNPPYPPQQGYNPYGQQPQSYGPYGAQPPYPQQQYQPPPAAPPQSSSGGMGNAALYGLGGLAVGAIGATLIEGEMHKHHRHHHHGGGGMMGPMMGGGMMGPMMGGMGRGRHHHHHHGHHGGGGFF